jgi:hypothetical protein
MFSKTNLLLGMKRPHLPGHGVSRAPPTQSLCGARQREVNIPFPQTGAVMRQGRAPAAGAKDEAMFVTPGITESSA